MASPSSSPLIPDPNEESDQRPVLKLQALAALRRTRMKASGNCVKTRIAVEVVSEEAIKDPNESRLMRTIRLTKPVNGFAEPAPEPGEPGEPELVAYDDETEEPA